MCMWHDKNEHQLVVTKIIFLKYEVFETISTPQTRLLSFFRKSDI